MLLVVLLAGCVTAPEPTRDVVVRGDTLGEIATAHGVSVDELRRWNGIEGDLIEVDQVLVIHAPAETLAPERTTVKSRPRRRTAARTSSVGATLSAPEPKPCLDPPGGDPGDELSMVASRGLSSSQVKSAFDAFVPHTTVCVPDDWTGSATVQLDLVIGCDGLVRDASVVSGGGLPDAALACLTERVRLAEFPAHDLPDGERARVPLRLFKE